jgi:hypothetical protein
MLFRYALATALFTSLAAAQTGGFEFNDSHFHLTNYVQASIFTNS